MSIIKPLDLSAIRERAEDMRAERSLDYYAKLLVADAADVQPENLTNGDVVGVGNLCSEYLLLLDALAAAEARVATAIAATWEEAARVADMEANASHVAASQAISRGAMSTFDVLQARAHAFTYLAAALRGRGRK